MSMTPDSWNSCPEVVAFARPLAHAGEHGEAAVLGRDVVDQLLNDDRLADTSAAEQADLAALEKRLDEVDDLDAGLEHLFRGGLLVERRRLPMDRHVHLGVHRAKLVDRFAQHVEHAAQRLTADRNHDAVARVDAPSCRAPCLRWPPSRCSARGPRPDAAAPRRPRRAASDVEALARDAQRLVDRRHARFVELHVNGRAADRNYFSDILCHSLSSSSVASYSAAAPLTISIISLVIAACRTRFIVRLQRVDQVAGVLRRGVRRRHPRRMLRRRRLPAAHGRSASSHTAASGAKQLLGRLVEDVVHVRSPKLLGLLVHRARSGACTLMPSDSAARTAASRCSSVISSERLDRSACRAS